MGDDVVQIAGQGLPLVLPEPLVEDLEVPHSLLAAAALLGEVAHGPSDEGHDEQRNEQIPEDASVEPSLAERRGRHDPGEVDGKVDFDEAVRRRGQDRHRHHGRRDDRRPVVVQYQRRHQARHRCQGCPGGSPRDQADDGVGQDAVHGEHDLQRRGTLKVAEQMPQIVHHGHERKKNEHRGQPPGQGLGVEERGLPGCARCAFQRCSYISHT